MWTEPLSVTLLGEAKSLPRTGVTADGSSYTEADREAMITVSHRITGRNRARRSIRLDLFRTAADPLAPSLNAVSSMAMTIGIDVPLLGFTATEQKDVVKNTFGVLTANTDALLIKWIGGES